MFGNRKYYFCLLFLFFAVGAFALEEPLCNSLPNIAAPCQQKFSSPTFRFLAKHPFPEIHAKLAAEGVSFTMLPLFYRLIDAENEWFIGYHGGCSDYRLFQDLVRFTVEEVLGIYVPGDFHFLRVPGVDNLNFASAEAFLKGACDDVDDTQAEIQRHLLSLNIALFQCYDFPLDFTPRYFLQNYSWSRPDYWKFLLEFVQQAGIEPDDFKSIIAIGRSLLIKDRGILIQFFVRPCSGNANEFLDAHFYVSHTKGKPNGTLPPSFYLKESTVSDFPQLRLVINNEHVLNPYSCLRMQRYDAESIEDLQTFNATLRGLIRSLPRDTCKQAAARDYLLSLWKI